MLDHDDCVVECSDRVRTTGTCETCLRIVVVTDTCGVYVTVRVDLSAADESNDTIIVVDPVVCLETDETDVRPLATAVSHETKVTYGTRNLDRVTVHKTGLYDKVTFRCE